MGETYFVQLLEINTTINLASIQVIMWEWIPDELLDTGCTTTVFFITGNSISITENDARQLWRSLQGYNTYKRQKAHSTTRKRPVEEQSYSQEVSE